MLPSSLSRSRQYSALSIHAKALYPLLMANADDQGRLAADPDTLKWEVCPNVPEIPPERIPELLAEMQRAGLAIIYEDGQAPALQLTQWWADQSSMEWAYPSDFSPPQGWRDRIRIRGSRRVITINWPGAADSDPTTLATEVPRQLRQSTAFSDIGYPSDTHPTPVRQHEHEHEHEHELKQEHEGTPPTPPTAPAAPRRGGARATTARGVPRRQPAVKSGFQADAETYARWTRGRDPGKDKP